MHQPDDRISVVLTAMQWNMVMQIMAEAPMPHRIVDPYIRSIQQQCTEEALAPAPDLHLVDNLTG